MINLIKAKDDGFELVAKGKKKEVYYNLNSRIAKIKYLDGDLNQWCDMWIIKSTAIPSGCKTENFKGVRITRNENTLVYVEDEFIVIEDCSWSEI